MNFIKNIDVFSGKGVDFIYGLAGDPPHIGHLQAIKYLLKLNDSHVWVVLSASHAYGKKTAPYVIRKEWLEILIFNNDILSSDEKSRIILKDIELDIIKDKQKSIVYSFDLKEYFEEYYENKNFVWAFGEDNTTEENIKKFKFYEKIIEWDILIIPEFFSLHSTQIRKEIRNNNTVFLKESLTEKLAYEIIKWVKQPQGRYWIEHRD